MNRPSPHESGSRTVSLPASDTLLTVWGGHTIGRFPIQATGNGWEPSIHIQENETRFLITIEIIHGMIPEVVASSDRQTITVRRPTEQPARQPGVISDTSRTDPEKTISLPAPFEASGITSRIESNWLWCVVPKQQSCKPKPIPIRFID